MVKVYAVVLVVGIVALFAWIISDSAAEIRERSERIPDVLFGLMGRRVVAAMVGFGMAGMSAEFSPRDIAWPWALLLAVVGAAAAAWYAGVVSPPETT